MSYLSGYEIYYSVAMENFSLFIGSEDMSEE